MVSRLSPPQNENDDPRGDLDAHLEVAVWQNPWTRRYDEADVPAGAPTWWHGEEEASDSFLKAMGIDASKLGVNP